MRTVLVRSAQRDSFDGSEAVPLKQGWLMKQSVGALVKNWRTRWVILWPARIEWFEKPPSVGGQMKGSLPLTKDTSAPMVESGMPPSRRLAVRSGHKTLLVQAALADDTLDWQRAILATIDIHIELETEPHTSGDKDAEVVMRRRRQDAISKSRLSINRMAVQSVQAAQETHMLSIHGMLQVPSNTLRATHLMTLSELIGPKPLRPWTDEWAALRAESLQLTHGTKAMSNSENPPFTHTQVEPLAVLSRRFATAISGMVGRGWPHEQAEVYSLLSACRNALGRALRDRDSCYASSTHALSEVLVTEQHRQALATDEQRNRRLYFHRTGKFSRPAHSYTSPSRYPHTPTYPHIPPGKANFPSLRLSRAGQTSSNPTPPASVA